MDGPPVSLHVADDACPVKFNTLALVSLHYQGRVKRTYRKASNLVRLEK